MAVTLVLITLRKILATPIRIPGHHLVAAVVVLLLFAVFLRLAGAGLPPPCFVLGRDQAHIDPLDYQLWRRASDVLAGRKYAVLTFDDGPYGDGVDERILDILHRHHARAMFFLVCSHLSAATNHVPGEIESGGHVIGNHSYDHLHLNQLDSAGLQHQVEGCSAQLAELTGQRPQYFRPPFGQTSPRVRQAVQAAGMEQVLWNANSQDSWLLRPDQILYWSMAQTGTGSILLMHDKPTTAAALDRVLTELEQRGFRFVLPVESLQAGREDRQSL